jgi:hypothetical protein
MRAPDSEKAQMAVLHAELANMRNPEAEIPPPDPESSL